MRRLTRREFLGRGVCAGFGFGACKFLTGCGAEYALPSPPTTPSETPARVAAIRGHDLYQMTRQALEAIGGIQTVVHPGETVFLKPNLGPVGLLLRDPIPTGECTKPEVVIAVAEECLRAGAAEVIIGEAGQVLRFSWEDCATLDGGTNLAAEAQRLNAAYPGKVRLACLNADTPVWDAVPSPHSGLNKIYVSSLVARADRVISIPVLKTNRWTRVTASLKNFLGVTPLGWYGVGVPWRYRLHYAPGGVAQCFLDVAAALQPDLTVIDASIGCEGNGPYVLEGWWGNTVDMRDRLGDWLVLASTDLVAADATAARIIGHEASAVDYLVTAYHLGLGQMREDLIELVGATLDELRVDWLPAEPTEGFAEVLLPALMLLLSESTGQG